MRFFTKTACNFSSFSGNLKSLEDISDEVTDDDQEVQPQTENQNRNKQKDLKKENTYRTSLSKFTKNTWPCLKDQKKGTKDLWKE